MADPTVPDFTDVAASKLADLLEKGFVITGVCFERQVDGTQPQRGFVDFAGFVGWWRAQPHSPCPGVEIDAYRVGALKVERVQQRQGGDLWAVRSASGSVLNKQGELEWEPQPSSRDDEFIARCRYSTVQEAMAAAHGVADMKGSQDVDA